MEHKENGVLIHYDSVHQASITNADSKLRLIVSIQGDGNAFVTLGFAADTKEDFTAIYNASEFEVFVRQLKAMFDL